MTAMMSVQILGVHANVASGYATILLGPDDTAAQVLPIVIGLTEAQAIVSAIAGVEPPRPGTHDLLVTVMTTADARLEEVAVTELRDGTFFAELFVEMATGLKRISSRPSDGIALAVRVGAPIVVNKDVFELAAVEVERESPDSFSDEEVDEIVSEFQDFLSTAQASDFETSDDQGDEPDEV